MLRAAEIDYYYATYTPMIAGKPYPLGWARKWALIKRRSEQLKAELEADYQMALERGAQLSEAELAQEVRTYLDNMLG